MPIGAARFTALITVYATFSSQKKSENDHRSNCRKNSYLVTLMGSEVRINASFCCGKRCVVGVSRTFSWIWLLLYMNTQAPASVTAGSYRQDFWPRPGSDKATCWIRPYSALRSTGSWVTWMPIRALGWARHPLPILCMLTIPPYSRHHHW